MELVRATEAAALAAARWMGRGDKNAADGPRSTRCAIACEPVDMDGVVVIGEGEKDEAPMLYIGEQIGNGQPPQVDIAVDPIDGTRLTALGLPGAIAVVALGAAGHAVRRAARHLLHGENRRRAGSGRMRSTSPRSRRRTTCDSVGARQRQRVERHHGDDSRPARATTR